MSLIRNTLLQDAYWKINKRLVKEIGIEAAVLLTDIIEKYYYHIDNKTALIRENRCWFFYLSQDIKDTFGLGYKVQKRLLFELSELKFITTKLFLTPAKLHISIDEKNIEMLICSSFTKRANLDLPNGEINIDPNGETIINNTDIKSLPNGNDNSGELFGKTEVAIKRFKKPTTEQIKEYFRILGWEQLATEYENHYKSNGWKVGKNKMADWEAAARNWVARHKEKLKKLTELNTGERKSTNDLDSILEKYQNA